MKLTKEQFRTRIVAAVEEIISVPDDLWNTFYPVMRIKFKSGETFVVGIEEVEGSDDDD